MVERRHHRLYVVVVNYTNDVFCLVASPLAAFFLSRLRGVPAKTARRPRSGRERVQGLWVSYDPRGSAYICPKKYFFSQKTPKIFSPP